MSDINEALNTLQMAIADECAKIYKEGIAIGRYEAFKEVDERLRYLWKKYEDDKENVPKPPFTEAIALITMLELEADEKSGTITECPMCMDCPDNCPLDKEKINE